MGHFVNNPSFQQFNPLVGVKGLRLDCPVVLFDGEPLHRTRRRHENRGIGLNGERHRMHLDQDYTDRR
jgi:hypothetical protein